MSLTIFVHRKLPKVGIVRWFRDPKVNIAYANGPLVEMSLGHFRSVGYEWVRCHFLEYLKIRIPEDKVQKVFHPGEAKKKMQDCNVIEITRDPSGNLILAPKLIRRYNLVDLESFGRESCRIISEHCTPETFWQTFDEAMDIASEN